jgi:phosphoribosylformylglycinamidine synthase
VDPYEGAKGALVEECGNVIANGAKPMAMVNCCNFGNPEIPESYWYFSKAVVGMNDFCRNIRIPIVGGNVSFYNEDEVKKIAIKATPMMMIVGLIEGEENIITLPFKKADDDIFLIGETKAELGGSEYHSVIYNLEGGIPPKVDESKIKATWDFLYDLYKRKLVKANHDISKGGIVINLAEMCFKNKLGAHLDFSSAYNKELSDDEFLFSESVGRFIIETEPNNYEIIINLANQFDVEINKIGVLSTNPEITINGLKSQSFKLNIEKMKKLFDLTIPNLMEI